MARVAPKDRYVKANGIRLHYLDWGGGDKPVLVLVHGLTSNAHAWDPFIRSGFAPVDRYRILSVDQRGHGDSDHARDYSIERFAEDFRAFAEKLDLGKYDLLGHSLGARHAMAYAGDDSKRLRHLVLVDFGPEMERTGASQVRGNTTQRPTSFRNLDEAVQSMREMNPGRPDDVLRENAQHAFRENYAGRLVWKHDAELGWISGSFGLKEVPYLWSQVAKIKCPTLIVRGADSNILGPGVLARILDVMPTARAVEIPQAGHGVPQDQPEAFWREVNAFLQEPGGKKRARIDGGKARP